MVFVLLDTFTRKIRQWDLRSQVTTILANINVSATEAEPVMKLATSSSLQSKVSVDRVKQQIV